MNTKNGYSKKALTDTRVLLAGGGDKPLSDFMMLGDTPSGGGSSSSAMPAVTFTDLVHSTASSCYFYFGEIKPTDYYGVWHIKYKVDVSMPGYSSSTNLSTDGKNYGHGLFIVELWGTLSSLIAYSVYNNHASTSYRTIYTHLLYRLTKAGIDAGYGHMFGIRTYSSWYPNITKNARTAILTVLGYDNCTVDLITSSDKYFTTTATTPSTSAVIASSNYKYATTPYDGATALTLHGPSEYLSALSEPNGTDNGLLETGDANTDVRYQVRQYYPRLKVCTGGAITRYSMCMLTPDGGVTSICLTNCTTDALRNSNTKTMYTGDLLIEKVYYYASTTTVAAGSILSTANVFHEQNGDLFSYTYSLNCYGLLTGNKTLYLVGSIADSGYFRLDATKPWSCDLPTSEDGKIYIRVGYVYADTTTYRGTLEALNQAYIYRNGRIERYINFALYAKYAPDYLSLSGGSVTGSVTFASPIIGNLLGNATSADRLSNPISITIGSTTKTLDGSSDLSWTTDLLGVVTLTTTQTISGAKTFSNEVTMTYGGTSDISYGIRCAFKTNMSLITNLITNTIYTGGTSSQADIIFYKYGAVTSYVPSTTTELFRIYAAGGFKGTGNGTVTGNLISDLGILKLTDNCLMKYSTTSECLEITFT